MTPRNLTPVSLVPRNAVTLDQRRTISLSQTGNGEVSRTHPRLRPRIEDPFLVTVDPKRKIKIQDLGLFHPHDRIRG